MIDLFFAVLNLAILGTILGYASYIYVIPQLKKNIIQDYHDYAKLQNEHTTLVADQHELEKRINTQENDAKYLLSTINLWRVKVEQEVKKQSIEQVKMKKELAEKTAEQARNYTINSTSRQIAPLIVEQLKGHAKLHFMDPVAAHTYIESLLHRLKSTV